MAQQSGGTEFDVSALIADRTSDFTGRGWVFAKINAWLADPKGPRTFFLAGGPGSGKTSVAARLVQMSAGKIPSADYPRLGNESLAFFYFCQAQIDASLVPKRWIESLAMALAKRYPAYSRVLTGGVFVISEQALEDVRAKGVPEALLNQLASLQNENFLEKENLLQRIQALIGEQAAKEHWHVILENLIHNQTRDPSIKINAQQTVGSVAQDAVVKNISIESLQVGELPPRLAFDQVIRVPLEVLCALGFKETILILVDGLDEALTYGENSIVTLLGDVSPHPQDLPAQVRFLLTSRPDPRVIHTVGIPSLHLIDDAPDDVDDVQTYIGRRLHKLPETQGSKLTAQIAQAGAGNFLYARYVLDDLLDKSGMLKTEVGLALALPKDLLDVYRKFLRRELGRTLEKWSDRYQKLLGIVAVSREDGLTSEQLANVTGIPQSETDRILQVCSQYLSSSRPEGPFRIYHESFREFLLSDKAFRIYPGEAHWAIARFYIKEYEDAWLQCDEDYALLHTLTHLDISLRSAMEREQRQNIKDALANLLTDLGFIERKTVRIGIDAVRSDLWSAIDMALLEPETTAVLNSVLYILDSEAKVLGGWDHDRHPHFFVQQIYLRSARLKAISVAKLCEEHLRRGGVAYLKYVWMSEYDSAELERTLLGQRNHPVERVAATPDGRWIVSQTNANEVSVWELETGRELHRLGQGRSRNMSRRSPIAVALTRDSRYAIVEESSYELTVWNLKSGKYVQSMRIPSPASWSPADKTGMWTLGQSSLLHWSRHGWQVLDIGTLESQRTLDIPAEGITAAAVAANGLYLVYGDADGAVHILDLVDCKESSTLRSNGSVVHSMSLTPNGRWLALAGEDKTLQVWDLHARSLRWTTPSRVATPFAVTPEGDRAVFAEQDYSLYIWDLEANQLERTLRGHAAKINDIAVTSDGRRIISAADDGTVRIWNIVGSANTGSLPRSSERRSHASSVTALTVTLDGKYALTGSIDGVKVWIIGSGIAERALAGQDGWVDRIALRPHGRQLTVLSSRGYGQLEITIVDAGKRGQSEWRYRWSGVRTARVYDLPTWQEICSGVLNSGDMEEFKKHEADAARQINRFRVLTSSLPVSIIDRVYQRRNVLTYVEHKGGPARELDQLGGVKDLLIEQILISDDGKLIYFGERAEVYYAGQWDWQTQPETVNLTGAGDIRFGALTPDGRCLILAMQDGSLEVYDLLARQRMTPFGEHKSRVYDVAVAPDGQTVLSLSEDGIGFIWDLQTAKQKLSCRLPGRFEIRAITADSRRAVLSAPGRPIIEIPLESSDDAGIRTLDGHTNSVRDVTVTQDGCLALSSSEDCTVKLWSLQSERQLASATLDHPAQRAVFALDRDLIIAGDAAGNVYCLRYVEAAKKKETASDDQIR